MLLKLILFVSFHFLMLQLEKFNYIYGLYYISLGQHKVGHGVAPHVIKPTT